jgi:FkbM family methyltransferase
VILSPIQRLRRRFGTLFAFAATGSHWKDKYTLALAGLARHRPFGDDSIYARFGRRLTSGIAPRVTAAGGQRIALNLSRVEEPLIFEEIFVDRIYPLELVPFTPDVVIDCGAFCGMFILLARARFPLGRFVAIEPEPHNFIRLTHNLAINQAQVEVLPAAVGVADGTVRFSGSGFGGHVSADEAVGTIEVRVLSLAGLLRRLQPQQLLLKLDVEGAEREILPHILPFLPASTVIFLETHHEEAECQHYLRPCADAGFSHELIRNRLPDDPHALFLERVLVRHRPVVRQFCTYFDNNYSAMGLALYQSLRQHCPAFQLWVLCLDEACLNLLTRLALPNLRIIRLDDFERDDAPLHAAKQNRSKLEYYFTCTPSLPLYLLRQHPELDMITYLDADLYFFGEPEPLFVALGSDSIAIIEHRFTPHLTHMHENGLYNVGWLSFRNDANGLACLQSWREQCLEWCYNRHEPGRYADQRYLDDWPQRFSGVVVLPFKGANLAMWNLGNYRLKLVGDKIMVNDEPLIFFHFHGLRRPQGWLFSLSTGYYGIVADELLLWNIFIPFIRQLIAAERTYGASALPGRRFSVDQTDSMLSYAQKFRLTASILASLARRNSVVVIKDRIIALP